MELMGTYEAICLFSAAYPRMARLLASEWGCMRMTKRRRSPCTTARPLPSITGTDPAGGLMADPLPLITVTDPVGGLTMAAAHRNKRTVIKWIRKEGVMIVMMTLLAPMKRLQNSIHQDLAKRL
jgi:hypothetical protein